MALSEHEQQVFDDMERDFYQSESDVMKTSPSNVRLNLRLLVLGIVLALFGVGVLLAGVGTQWLWLGLVGFGLMLGGILLAFSKREDAPHAGSTGARKAARASSDSFSDRMNRRWEQRMDGDR